jgi:alkaline phosphatase D
VEFAGTAVSSPSSFGYNSTLNSPLSKDHYTSVAEKLIGNATANVELQWTEGATRGYFELYLSRQNATAVYYGIDDVRTRNSDEKVIATFVVEDKANKLARPVAGGSVESGLLRTAFP